MSLITARAAMIEALQETVSEFWDTISKLEQKIAEVEEAKSVMEIGQRECETALKTLFDLDIDALDGGLEEAQRLVK